MDQSSPRHTVRSSSTNFTLLDAYLDIAPQDYLDQGPAGNPPMFDNNAVSQSRSVDSLKLPLMNQYTVSRLALAHFALPPPPPPPKRRFVLDAPVRQPDPIPSRQSIHHILNHVADDSSDSSSETSATTTIPDTSESSFDSQAAPRHERSYAGEPDILRRLLYLEWRAMRTHQTLHEMQQLMEKIYTQLVAEPTQNMEE